MTKGRARLNPAQCVCIGVAASAMNELLKAKPPA